MIVITVRNVLEVLCWYLVGKRFAKSSKYFVGKRHVFDRYVDRPKKVIWRWFSGILQRQQTAQKIKQQTNKKLT